MVEFRYNGGLLCLVRTHTLLIVRIIFRLENEFSIHWKFELHWTWTGRHSDSKSWLWKTVSRRNAYIGSPVMSCSRKVDRNCPDPVHVHAVVSLDCIDFRRRLHAQEIIHDVVERELQNIESWPESSQSLNYQHHHIHGRRGHARSDCL